MKTLLDEIDILAAKLNDLHPIKQQDKQRLDKKFRLEFSFNSNHLEGNTLTYSETELLLIFDDTKGDHTMREYEEMKAHDVAYHLIEDWAQDKEHTLTEQNIKNLNEIILVRPFWKDAITPTGQSTRRQINVGNYKQHPNSVRLQNGEIFEYASPIDTPIKMQELLDWYRAEKAGLHPVALAAMLHYKFVTIHPFDDGNGRVSRLLMNYVLLSNGLPPVVIKSIDKAGYLRALNRADSGDYETFINYVAEQLIWSLELSIQATKGEDIGEPDDWRKKLEIIKTQTSNRDPLKKTRSEQAVQDIVQKSLIPLMKRIVDILSPFDELFAKKSFTFFKGPYGNTIPSIEFLVQQLNARPTEFNTNMRFIYQLDGFKRNGKKPFSCYAEIYWNLDDYMYYTGINSNNQGKQERHFFDEYYSEDEINRYTKECAEKIVNEIESHLGQY